LKTQTSMKQESAALPAKGDKRRVRQSANRAAYDQESLYQVLDAASIGHVSFIHEGWPQSIPTAIARIDQHLYLHGSRSSRLYMVLAAGDRVCVSVCLVDGLVKSRSAFHCSMNYRSAVVFGCGEVVTGDEKIPLLNTFTEQLIPGTANDYRPMLSKEIKATELIRIPLNETSVKIRTGDPIDDNEDIALDHWAGIIPLTTTVGVPIASANLPASVTPKDELLRALTNY
jgi:nitroimidazol reductase NimA-like FMN-containing flavoprotein (pyridoxamine 5'-phosphate oxidase superfamily)